MVLSGDDKLWRDQNFPNMSDEELNKIVETFGDKKKEPNSKANANQVIEEASEFIMNQHKFITIEETGKIWYYKDGVYKPGGEILIAKHCEKMFDYDLNNERLSQIKGHIVRRTYHKHEELDADTNIINLKNGLYDVDNDVIRPHTPEYLSINQKPIVYDKNAKAERFELFLSEVLYQRDIRTAIEAAAYTFERDYPIEVIFILLGNGSNGKTVFTSLLTALHGIENVSNVPLSEMIRDHFALSDLENKDLNIDNELGNQIIKDTAILKRLTGGSRQQIRIQRKMQQAYDTTLYAKLVFNANKIPETEDTTDAMNRRVIIISFPNRFDGSKADKKLIQKLTNDTEMSGIFNILMDSLRLIRTNKDIYVNESTIEERRLKYLRSHDSVKAFLEETIDWENSTESQSDHYISKADLHLIYGIYCGIHRIPVQNHDTFCRRIKKIRSLVIDKEDTPIMINESRKSTGEKDKNGKPRMSHCWIGIKLIEEYATELLAAKQKKEAENAQKEGQARLD